MSYLLTFVVVLDTANINKYHVSGTQNGVPKVDPFKYYIVAFWATMMPGCGKEFYEDTGPENVLVE